MMNVTSRRLPGRFLVFLCLTLAAGLAGFVPLAARADIEIMSDDSALSTALQETPILEQAVASGQTPPVSERLPDTPSVYSPLPPEVLGEQGGEWRMLVGREKDVRLGFVYGYARLVGYSEALEFQPDILKEVVVEDGRAFTLKLRPGHRWSDGAPFTSEDFRYWWEDMANNEELSPVGPPASLIIEGELPTVTYPDSYTVRYEWSRPNPFFLASLARALPLVIYSPSHYLKQFHKSYAEPEALAKRVEENGMRDWAQLHGRRDNLSRFDNPALPTLQPWMPVTEPPSTRFELKRNPFFHRVDSAGKQLPYLDQMTIVVTGGDLIPVKSGAGDADLQARGLRFDDYTFLKQSEERSGYEVRLWDTVRGSEYAIYPNLTVSDPVWRELNRDVRYRRALSLGVNRHEVNQVIYFGLANEGNQSILPGSSLYDPELRQRYASYDLERANLLLDELGLTQRDDRGIRLLPDGRPMEIVVETAGESSLESDLLELIGDSWLKLGIKIFNRPMQREVLRNRVFAGETVMTLWLGYENAVISPGMSPEEFVPVHQDSFHWPKWGQYHENKGASGEGIDMPVAQRLMGLYEKWVAARSTAERRAIWKEILEIHADQVLTIGLVAQVPQPVVVMNGFENVPEKAIYNWDPGAHFGIYRPDTFWQQR
ncbi:MAG: ABC transporter substrate-binding protein [Limibacillus sp.]